jgi:tRNA(Ile)-lysidine synthase TilS/MesJ
MLTAGDSTHMVRAARQCSRHCSPVRSRQQVNCITCTTARDNTLYEACLKQVVHQLQYAHHSSLILQGIC